jgi:hypothetical protein
MKRAMRIEGMDRELKERITDLARREGRSVNETALRLLRNAAGVEQQEAESAVVGNSLDHLIGCWSVQEERDFLKAVEVFEQIDESLWR